MKRSSLIHWLLAIVAVLCVTAFVQAEPTQPQVDDLRQLIRDVRDLAKSMKDDAGNPTIQGESGATYDAVRATLARLGGKI